MSRRGGDIEWIRKGIGSDPRIGAEFLSAGVGYGGSCFPKDVKALTKTAADHGLRLRILQAVDEVNENQKKILLRKLANHFENRLANKTLAIWGLSFKPQTNDIREAPSLTVIQELLKMSANVRAFDPIANDAAKPMFDGKVEFYQSAYDPLRDADALIVMTEWNEFRRPDFEKMKKLMRSPTVFDGRNIYDPFEMQEKGFQYYGIGRGSQGSGHAWRARDDSADRREYRTHA